MVDSIIRTVSPNSGAPMMRPMEPGGRKKMGEKFYLPEVMGSVENYPTPWKINMEHNHGGLVQMIFLSDWVICRFHVNLPGCRVIFH